MKLPPILALVRLAASLRRAANAVRHVVSPIFDDHMVRQRAKPIRVEIWKTLGATVRAPRAHSH